eukprot:GSChrysophyteH1.ASY1.ANO1.1362.1 assembled CDS
MEQFNTKVILFLNRETRIVIQNANGPCPLIALANVLILENRLTFATEIVLLSDLLSKIANLVLSECTSESTDTLNQVESILENIPKLQRGLDLNISFSSTQSMEFTSELSIFDALRVDIHHGWVIDPLDKDRLNAIGNKGINQLYDELVGIDEARVSEDERARGIIIKEFLQGSCSHLTFYGLVKLHQSLREKQIAVLYRNAHFSTFFRRENRLYILVTDEGYQHQRSVVWECFDSIDGDTEFLDSNFRPATAEIYEAPSVDHILAMQMQEEETRRDVFQRSRFDDQRRERKQGGGDCGQYIDDNDLLPPRTPATSNNKMGCHIS